MSRTLAIIILFRVGCANQQPKGAALFAPDRIERYAEICGEMLWLGQSFDPDTLDCNWRTSARDPLVYHIDWFTKDGPTGASVRVSPEQHIIELTLEAAEGSFLTDFNGMLSRMRHHFVELEEKPFFRPGTTRRIGSVWEDSDTRLVVARAVSAGSSSEPYIISYADKQVRGE